MGAVQLRRVRPREYCIGLVADALLPGPSIRGSNGHRWLLYQHFVLSAMAAKMDATDGHDAAARTVRQAVVARRTLCGHGSLLSAVMGAASVRLRGKKDLMGVRGRRRRRPASTRRVASMDRVYVGAGDGRQANGRRWAA